MAASRTASRRPRTSPRPQACASSSDAGLTCPSCGALCPSWGSVLCRRHSVERGQRRAMIRFAAPERTCWADRPMAVTLSSGAGISSVGLSSIRLSGRPRQWPRPCAANSASIWLEGWAQIERSSLGGAGPARARVVFNRTGLGCSAAAGISPSASNRRLTHDAEGSSVGCRACANRFPPLRRSETDWRAVCRR